MYYNQFRTFSHQKLKQKNQSHTDHSDLGTGFLFAFSSFRDISALGIIFAAYLKYQVFGSRHVRLTLFVSMIRTQKYLPVLL